MPESTEPRRRGYMPPSKSVEYETPAALFDQLDAQFGPFTCDPACRGHEHSAQTIANRGGLLLLPLPEPPPGQITPPVDTEGPYSFGYDGLAHPWQGRVWLNPPYGRNIRSWLEKAVAEVSSGQVELVCALLPAATSASWWQDLVMQGVASIPGLRRVGPFVSSVTFLPGRVRFTGQQASAPFGSAVVVWSAGGVLM